MDNLSLFQQDINNGSLSVKEWNIKINENKVQFKKIKIEMFNYVCQHGTIHQVEWLYRIFNIDLAYNKCEVLFIAIDNENFEIADFILGILRKKKQLNLKKCDFHKYITKNKKNIIKWFINNNIFDSFPLEALVESAVLSHDLDLIQFYASKFEISCGENVSNAWFTAFSEFSLQEIEKIEVLNLLDYSTYGKTFLVKACYGGKFDTVKYLIENKGILPTLGCHINNCECCSSFLGAITSGNLDIVKYLYDHEWTELGYDEGKGHITILDMYKCVSFETHIDVFKFLLTVYPIDDIHKDIIRSCIKFDSIVTLEYLKSIGKITDEDIIEAMTSHCEHVKMEKRDFYSNYHISNPGKIIRLFEEKYGWKFVFSNDGFVLYLVEFKTS